jgi:hypothetical protein
MFPIITATRYSDGRSDITMTCPYDAKTVDALRNMRGAKWDKHSKLWRFPCDRSIAEALLALMPNASYQQHGVDLKVRGPQK